MLTIKLIGVLVISGIIIGGCYLIVHANRLQYEIEAEQNSRTGGSDNGPNRDEDLEDEDHYQRSGEEITENPDDEREDHEI